ncbi:MAG: hypothetical protein HUJ31_12490 [Pseudomonadales bacterium]|nr:hypothetical protein [Pseudomonadales bacterium]
MMTSFEDFRKAWVKATTLGFLMFLLMIPISLILLSFFRPPELEGQPIAQILQQAATRSALDYGLKMYIALQSGHFIHYLIVGTVLALLQYNILREFIRNKVWWTAMTVLGLEVILLGDLIFMGLSTGGAPGPLEPLLIGLGGGGLMAFMQYLYLRSTGVTSGKWVGWWILGILTGILASALVIFIYEFFIAEHVRQAVPPLASVLIGWLSFILPYFGLIGFFAGLLSARPLYRALQSSQGEHQ